MWRVREYLVVSVGARVTPKDLPDGATNHKAVHGDPWYDVFLTFLEEVSNTHQALEMYKCETREVARQAAAVVKVRGGRVHVFKRGTAAVSSEELSAAPTFQEAIAKLASFAWSLPEALAEADDCGERYTAAFWADMAQPLQDAPSTMSIQLFSNPDEPAVLRAQHSHGITALEILQFVEADVERALDFDFGDHHFWEGISRRGGSDVWCVNLGS